MASFCHRLCCIVIYTERSLRSFLKSRNHEFFSKFKNLVSEISEIRKNSWLVMKAAVIAQLLKKGAAIMRSKQRDSTSYSGTFEVRLCTGLFAMSRSCFCRRPSCRTWIRTRKVISWRWAELRTRAGLYTTHSFVHLYIVSVKVAL